MLHFVMHLKKEQLKPWNDKNDSMVNEDMYHVSKVFSKSDSKQMLTKA